MFLDPLAISLVIRQPLGRLSYGGEISANPRLILAHEEHSG